MHIKTFLLLIILISASCFSSNLDRTIIENKSVEIILGIYWNASFNGNTEIVKTITTHRPTDFFGDCKLKIDNNINLENNDETEYIDFRNDLSKENDLTGMTSYIYNTKIKFTRLKIIEKKTFEDEAILTVLQADYSGNFERAEKFKFYFKRFKDGWKIVSYLDKPFFDLWSEPKYGAKRPFCK